MISNISLKNFRSYEDESFEFGSGVNIIVGPNGSGKTNLLEAIQVLHTGNSYRVDDMDLISFDKEWARLDAEINSQNRTIKFETQNNKVKKSYIFDDKPYKVLTYSHILPIVLFEPNHLLLLHGQPEQRRAYLDGMLAYSIPGFNMTLKHYRRVLLQRNALLKSANSKTKNQLFVWNLRLSELGGSIAKARHELIDSIKQELPGVYSKIAGSKITEIDIEYKSKLPRDRYESALLKALEASFDLDLARGFTGTGPHRDDFVVKFNGHPAADVASRGETRTALLALKINELHMIENKFSEKPILLLDDVFSELDGKRRHALTKYLKLYQTFITTTDADVVIQNFLDECTVIPLSSSRQ